MHYDSSVYYEVGTVNEKLSIRIRECLYSGATNFQDVAIYDTYGYGKMLTLDGLIQSTQADEYRYHESLVHPAMLAHPDPTTVLIIGGGEGATAREVLKHPSVEKVVMVDIDGLLIELCEKHLPEWSAGTFEDPRFELIVGDGLEYIESCQDVFDVIIIDVCDGFDEESPTLAFFQKPFYTKLKRILELRGIVAYQAMCASMDENQDFAKVVRGIESIFTYTNPYMTYMPSFWSQWGFVVASDVRNVGRITQDMVDTIIASRGIEDDLHFMDGASFTRMFCLPKDVRKVITDKSGRSADRTEFSAAPVLSSVTSFAQAL